MYDYLVTAFQPNVPPHARMVREQSPQLAAERWTTQMGYNAKSAPDDLVLAVTEVVSPGTDVLAPLESRVTHAFQLLTRLDVAPMELPF